MEVSKMVEYRIASIPPLQQRVELDRFCPNQRIFVAIIILPPNLVFYIIGDHMSHSQASYYESQSQGWTDSLFSSDSNQGYIQHY